MNSCARIIYRIVIAIPILREKRSQRVYITSVRHSVTWTVRIILILALKGRVTYVIIAGRSCGGFARELFLTNHTYRTLINVFSVDQVGVINMINIGASGNRNSFIGSVPLNTQVVGFKHQFTPA